ncbi:MAG: lamin tail domain-containing protein [Anaerolineae bacterium]
MVRDGDSWTADLPGLPARTRVTYYLHATFADGRTAFHPASNWVQPYRYRVAGPALPERPGGDLALNEIMADNAAVIADEAGEYDDWVELVNRGTAPVALEGYFLGPSPDDPWAFALPAGTLRPGERLLVWCDKDTSQGPLHAPFKLAKGGDGIVWRPATRSPTPPPSARSPPTGAGPAGRTATAAGWTAPRPARAR